MEFWGIEVKPGKPLKVTPDINKVIHVSQVALGEVKNVKGAISVPLRLKINGKDYVIGVLSAEDRPQFMLDLVFEKEFELSHDWKNGSVYFAGYMSPDDGPDEEACDVGCCDKDGVHEHGVADRAKYRGLLEENDGDDSDDESGDNSTDISLEDGSEPSFMDDSDFSDEDISSDDTPSKEQLTGKRKSESVAKIPVPAKKAKLPTPEKTVGKKGQAGKAPPANKSNGQAGKAPSAANKSNGQSPKSGGKFPQKSPNNKSLGSDSRKKGKQGRK